MVDVSNYQKLSRIGQGAYGTVCTCSCDATISARPAWAGRDVLRVRRRSINRRATRRSNRCVLGAGFVSPLDLRVRCPFVDRARDKRDDQIVALKKVHMSKAHGKEGFPKTSIREIKLLKKLHHPNIINLLDIAVGPKTGSVFLIFEYCHRDFADILDNVKRPFSESEVKCVLLQLLSAIDYLHANFIVHRDLKLSNILLDPRGLLKVADFGLARSFEHPLRPYTPKVVTLWYRSPELLLGESNYSTAVDIWAVGCIFAELLQNRPLFPGKSELDQISLICRTLGAPNERIWSGFAKLPHSKSVNFPEYTYNNLSTEFTELSDMGLDLLNSLLTFDPSKRITAAKALHHGYFREKPIPTRTELMPTFAPPESHAESPQSSHASGTKRARDQEFGNVFSSSSKR